MKLETKRLIMREPKMGDWKDLVGGLNDLEVSKNLIQVKYPYTEKDARSWVKHCVIKVKKEEKYNFYIELKSEKKIIGVLDLKVDSNNNIGTTGSWINKKYQRRGYMTEAKIAVNDFAFNKLKLRKLETSVFNFNIASNSTQKRMGYKIEGLKRKHSISKATGKIHDEKIYGLLKEEWKKARPKIIKHLDEKIKKLENRR